MADLGSVGSLMMGASALASAACYLNACRVPMALRDGFENIGQVLRGAFQEPEEPAAPEIEELIDQLNSVD